MAGIIASIKKLARSPVGQIIEVIVYAFMLLLVLIFFSNNGAFIYEAF